MLHHASPYFKKLHIHCSLCSSNWSALLHVHYCRCSTYFPVPYVILSVYVTLCWFDHCICFLFFLFFFVFVFTVSWYWLCPLYSMNASFQFPQSLWGNVGQICEMPQKVVYYENKLNKQHEQNLKVWKCFLYLRCIALIHLLWPDECTWQQVILMLNET